MKNKVKESENFYNESFLNFDYKLNYYNYITLKKYFKGTSCLELGPSTGFMTSRLVNDFEELYLVEGSKYLLDQIPDYTNVKKFHSFFEDFDIEKTFDTIIMSHVLEHIADPVFILKRIKKWLKPDGNLLISVPNALSFHRLIAVAMGLLNNVYELNERDNALGHYSVYDLNTLKSDVFKANYKIVGEGGIFFKPLSNGQIEKYLDDKIIEGYYKVGELFPNNCAEIFVIAKLN